MGRYNYRDRGPKVRSPNHQGKLCINDIDDNLVIPCNPDTDDGLVC